MSTSTEPGSHPGVLAWLRHLSTVALVVAACVIALEAWHRQSEPLTLNEPNEIDYIPGWEQALGNSRHVAGNPAAPVTVLVLVDLECAASRRFHDVLASVETQRESDMRTFYMHSPLPYHGQALGAAEAAECAAEVGAFRSWVDVVFRYQDSLGVQPWASLAAKAGIADSVYVAECARRTAPSPRVAAGTAFAEEIDAFGTPTLIVNGWRHPGPWSTEQLDSLITYFQETDN
jgi:protein-disulfide isomerase